MIAVGLEQLSYAGTSEIRTGEAPAGARMGRESSGR